MPKVKNGIYGVLADSNNGQSSAAAFLMIGASFSLTPAEGPPGTRVPLEGCNWFPVEQIDFAFTEDNVIFDTGVSGSNGCITSGGQTEPTLHIPPDATLGAKIIRATGANSGQKVNLPFTVVERSLVFDPAEGFPGDPVAVSGCGWVGNSTVKITWGSRDTNDQLIEWLANVDAATGCFGLAGDFVINVPLDTITGPLEQTATGDEIGEATGLFTVIHTGFIEIPAPGGYIGHSKTVNIHNAIEGELIEFAWRHSSGAPLGGVGVPEGVTDLSIDITLPLFAPIGVERVVATGTKNFMDSADVNILDNSQISVTTMGEILSGSTIWVEGTNWAATEFVSFKLVQGTDSWGISGMRVPTDAIVFAGGITVPASVPTGNYTLEAIGDLGRKAETTLAITAAPTPAFALTAGLADPPPDLDGSLTSGEWDYQQKSSFTNGFITALSDESRLYILLDLLGDTGNDSLGSDNFWLSFDIWNDQVIDAGWDLNFRLDGSGDMILEKYTGPNSFAPGNSLNLRSAYGAGFGCFSADGTSEVTFAGLIPILNCDSHRVFEIGIDLHTLLAQPGDVLRVGVRAQSQSPAFTEDNPANFHSDFTELGSITLAPSQLDPNPPAGTVTGIGSNGFQIEATQAIQDVNNSMALAAEKDTVVRIFPAVTSEALVRNFLFGRRNGQDLPGSPLVTLATIPPSIERELLSDTANFLLPSSWVNDGITELSTIVENLNGQNPQGFDQLISLDNRRRPIYWVIPINAGSAASPVLPPNWRITAQGIVPGNGFPGT